MRELPEIELAKRSRVVLVAPAGYGKTEVIARAVRLTPQDRQLVLTHTHAGVRALRDRFSKLNVPSRQLQVNTIAGWALSYAQAYPALSGLSIALPPSDHDWPLVYEAATQLLTNPSIQKVVDASYRGLYVDEYQDCSGPQHRLILALAERLPCRIVGDPLQGIFDFHEPVVDWEKEVFPQFERIDDLTIPWRWLDGRSDLGEWLEGVRISLLTGQSIDFQDQSVKWLKLDQQSQRMACFRSAGLQGTVVGIHKLPNQAHALARGLKSAFTSMDEVYCKDLFRFAQQLDTTSELNRAACVIEFARTCMTEVSTQLKSLLDMCAKGKIRPEKVKHKEIALALVQVATSQDVGPIRVALNKISEINGRVLYRVELWREMHKAMDEYESGRYPSLLQAAWQIRCRTSMVGRRLPRRTISRTLLIKGLEFDHAIVLDADALSAKELYVALTRGTRSLTVLSSSPTVRKDAPFCGLSESEKSPE